MTTLLQSAPPIKAASSHGDGHFYLEDNGTWTALYDEGGTFGMAAARNLKAEGQNVVPSATGIIGMLRKFQLEDYMKKNAAKAALELDRKAYADEDEWLDAVLAKSDGASKGAQDLGSRIHKAFEKALAGEDYEAAMKPYVDAIMAEIVAHGIRDGIESEQAVGSLRYGCAGKLDIRHKPTMTIGDIKSRGHKVNKVKPSKVPAYMTDWVQISFYGFCSFGNAFFRDGRGVVLATSTVIPGLVTPHVKTGPELVEYFEVFLGLLPAWRLEHRFDGRVGK